MLRYFRLSDGIIELRLVKTVKRFLVFPIDFIYDIYLLESNTKIGHCDYRSEDNEENYYAGNIGYLIFQGYRGHNYSLRAASLLCKLAKTNKKSILITCSPENIASYKIIKKLGGELLTIVDVPEYHYLYAQGEKVKCIFNLDLKRVINNKNNK